MENAAFAAWYSADYFHTLWFVQRTLAVHGVMGSAQYHLRGVSEFLCILRIHALGVLDRVLSQIGLHHRRPHSYYFHGWTATDPKIASGTPDSSSEAACVDLRRGRRGGNDSERYEESCRVL